MAIIPFGRIGSPMLWSVLSNHMRMMSASVVASWYPCSVAGRFVARTIGNTASPSDA